MRTTTEKQNVIIKLKKRKKEKISYNKNLLHNNKYILFFLFSRKKIVAIV